MATVLVRATAAPATDNDYFTDDEGSGHEANINAAAEVGLMTGCTATTFCPKPKVSRGQTMRLLHATFGADDPPPADEASLDGAFTDAGSSDDVTLAVARIAPDEAAIDGTAARWTTAGGSNALALAGLMECPIVRTDAADIG